MTGVLSAPALFVALNSSCDKSRGDEIGETPFREVIGLTHARHF